MLGIPVLAVLAGCLQAEQEAVLMPDGSGKVTITMAFRQMGEGGGAMMPGMPRARQGDPMKEFTDPLRLEEDAQGICAWVTEGPKEEDGWTRASVTGYFEDINKVKIYSRNAQTGKRDVSFVAVCEKVGDSSALILSNSLGAAIKQGQQNRQNQDPEVAKRFVEMLKPMMGDMKVSLSFEVPGEVQEASEFMKKRGRKAVFDLNADAIFAPVLEPDGPDAKRMKQFTEAEDATIVWSGNKVSDEDLAKFKKELERAKEEWAKTLEKAKKKKAEEAEKSEKKDEAAPEEK